jgi:hypothetical protein
MEQWIAAERLACDTWCINKRDRKLAAISFEFHLCIAGNFESPEPTETSRQLDRLYVVQSTVASRVQHHAT